MKASGSSRQQGAGACEDGQGAPGRAVTRCICVRALPSLRLGGIGSN
jgi:hypothetical protein